MSGISTHILNTAEGKPMAGIAVKLFQGNHEINSVATNADGRCPALLPPGIPLHPGAYRLVFEVQTPFYPEIQIAILVTDETAHYHVPLLLSPYGYTTYRGS